MKKQLFKDSMFLFIGTMLNSLITFLSQVLLTRNLSIIDYGSFITSFNIANLLAIFISFGTAEFILKSFGKEGHEAYRWIKVFSKIVPLTIFFSISVLIIISSLNLFSENTNLFILMLIPNIILQGLLPITISVYQIEKNFKKIALLSSLVYIIRFLAVLIGLYFNNSLEVIGYLLFVFSVLTFFYYFKQIKRYYKKNIIIPKVKYFELEDSSVSIKQGFKNILPYGLLAFFYYLFYQSNVLFINLFLGEVSVGYYNTAFLIISLTYLLPNILLGQLFTPRLHFWVHNDHEKIRKLFLIGNLSMFFLSLIIVSIIILGKNLIIFGIFGNEFSESVILLVILSLAIPFRYVLSVSDVIMNTENRIIIKTIIFFIVSILNIILNVVLIPKIGLVGAAISTLVSEIILSLTTLGFCYKYIKTIRT